ncbi:histidine phosphatase family protein [Streptomyces sp. NBC_00513]|uniref:histidine phosphatase family protein n=1 Tax=unclassified Streptomyces TaxID=2593676 RepID=UPI0022539619|nr:histidine phosphatase family protein [Streptomyces sp. NBC_00424]MCX5077610.1 histidine phosphatase family protein [Streptomyces sp. NBC_00424]WUD39419.1 histidine phosphatase family protein [Streptomyces sp. NBC_00513]
MGELIVIRHGQTEWSLSGRHAGRTDVALTEEGEAAASALAPRLTHRRLAAVFSSPLSRAMRTAELAGLTGAKPDPDLLEWDYGGYEGLTAEQIREARPGWDLWRDGVVPGDADHPGEELAQVAARTDAVLDRIRPLLSEGDVAVVAHGHLARVLTVRWLGLDASASRLLGHPHPGSLSFLATEDGHPVISVWNVPQGKGAVRHT